MPLDEWVQLLKNAPTQCVLEEYRQCRGWDYCTMGSHQPDFEAMARAVVAKIITDEHDIPSGYEYMSGAKKGDEMKTRNIELEDKLLQEVSRLLDGASAEERAALRRAIEEALGATRKERGNEEDQGPEEEA